MQSDSKGINEDNIEDIIQQSSGILCPTHSHLVSLKLRSFLSSDNPDDPDNINTGRDILNLANTLEPGYSLIRGRCKTKM